MKSRWIDHKGQRIFVCDYSGFKNDLEALKAENSAVQAELTAQPRDSVLELVDIRDTVGSREAVSLIKASASRTKPHIRKSAVLGITGVLKVLAQGVSRVSGLGLTLFEQEDAAKDWLVADR